MQHLSRRPWLGIGLIALGAILLLHQFHIVPIDLNTAWWVAVCGAGIYLIIRGFPNQGRGVFPGVCAMGIGGYELLKNYTSVYIPSYLVMPSLMILAGVGILFVYFSCLSRWHLLVPSLLLIGLGSLIVVAEEGYVDRWALIDFLRTWWPASLVLFGTALLLNQMRQKGGRST